MSQLKERLSNDVKVALKARDKQRVGALRLILAAIKQREVDERIELNDAQVQAVLGRLVKQRQESLEQFTRAGRDDLAAQEAYELELLQSYLPEALPVTELDSVIAAVMARTGATSIKDMGKVMESLKADLAGRADMRVVSDKVRKLLTE